MPDSITDLEARLSQAATPVERIDTLNALAWAVLRKDASRANALSAEALRLSKEGTFASAPYQKGVIEGQRTQASLQMYNAQYDQALTLAFEALALSDEIGKPEFKPAILNVIASCYHLLGDVSQSMDYFLKQEKVGEEVGDRLEAAKAMLGLGVVYFDMDDYPNLRLCSERSLAIFEELGQDYWIGLALNNLLYALFKLGYHEEALQRANQAQELCRRTGNIRGLGNVLNSLAEGYLNMNKPVEALSCLHEALLQAKKVNDPNLEIEALTLIGQTYLQSNQYEQALAPLQQAVTQAEKYKLWRNLYESHRFLAEAYKQLGDYPQALAHYETYHVTKETSFNEENARKIQNLEVLHRTQVARKEADYFARLYQRTQEFNTQLEAEVQKRTEDLRKAYEQLERLDRTKSDFITVTAHELRTPLTVLTGYAQILLPDPELQRDPKKKDLADGIVTGAKRLSEVIDTMLLMVKVDSRALEITSEPIDLSKIIAGIANELNAAIKDRRQTLEIGREIRSLPTVEGDKTALAIVFSKIIENAIKYTPDGGHIGIKGCTWETSPQPDLPEKAVEIIVSDTGIGIDLKAQELIFTKFYRTGNALQHSSSKTKFKGGGTGLGLAIARGIIEAHQGKLWVESEGHDEQHYPGSHFHIVIPLKQRFPDPA